MVDPGIKILVVDDSMVMRRIIRNYLKTSGYENVVEASKGIEALNILHSSKIDLIFSDWCMRGMQGIDLLKIVRGDERLRHIPFIMVSAEAQQHLVDEAYAEKVSHYVVKPFTREHLKDAIRRVMG